MSASKRPDRACCRAGLSAIYCKQRTAHEPSARCSAAEYNGRGVC